MVKANGQLHALAILPEDRFLNRSGCSGQIYTMHVNGISWYTHIRSHGNKTRGLMDLYFLSLSFSCKCICESTALGHLVKCQIYPLIGPAIHQCITYTIHTADSTTNNAVLLFHNFYGNSNASLKAQFWDIYSRGPWPGAYKVIIVMCIMQRKHIILYSSTLCYTTEH
jgi:hypothetical protein